MKKIIKVTTRDYEICFKDLISYNAHFPHFNTLNHLIGEACGHPDYSTLVAA